MADYDSFDYEINKRLPEWYKHSALAIPVNKYVQELIIDMLNGFLTSTGVAQPLNCWLTIPEEYDWYHHYVDTDDYLLVEQDNLVVNNAVSTVFIDKPITALLPNTKRKCHAKIRLKLLGGYYGEETNADYYNKNEEPVYQNNEQNYERVDSKGLNVDTIKTTIDTLSLKNGNQKIVFHNIPNTSTIEINTKTNEILVDNQPNSDLVEGMFNKIQPSIKYNDYIDPNTGEEIDISDENKETKIVIESTNVVKFDLQIKLYKPTYTTEQNIRIATVSAFPIEWVRLYGYYCHPFNNKQGYKYLWEKTYTLDSRTTFDRISKQFDCERFYIEVKFHGIGTSIRKGFPQELFSTELCYQPNPNLDKWGKIYGLPRQMYKTTIKEEEEENTFPKYYTYPIEQDYWYEERMINEYRINDDCINSLFIKDTDLNNIMSLDCIYPYMNDIWVYTETINPDADILREIKNIELVNVFQDEDSVGISWGEDVEVKGIMSSGSIPMTLNPKSSEIRKLNDYSFRTKTLKLQFRLKNLFKNNNIPRDINVKGIELRFQINTDSQSGLLRLSEDSTLRLPYFIDSIEDVIYDYVSIDAEQYWENQKEDKGGEKNLNPVKQYFRVGGNNYLFGENHISYDQLTNDILEFSLSFVNNSDFHENNFIINDVVLNVYYETRKEDFSINLELPSNVITPNNNEEQYNFPITLHIKNNGEKEVYNKDITVVASSVFNFPQTNSYKFDLQKGEEFSIDVNMVLNKPENSEVFKSGYYDIIAFCDEKVIKKEVLIHGGN